MTHGNLIIQRDSFKLEVKNVLEAISTSSWFLNKSISGARELSIVVNFDEDISNIYVEGFRLGMQVVLDFVSSESVQIINYEYMMQARK